MELRAHTHLLSFLPPFLLPRPAPPFPPFLPPPLSLSEALISDNLKNVVAVIEERHLDILKLEHQVLEIYELFRDLATLVDLQQESLDVIENRIMKAKNYTE